MEPDDVCTFFFFFVKLLDGSEVHLDKSYFHMFGYKAATIGRRFSGQSVRLVVLIFVCAFCQR